MAESQRGTQAVKVRGGHGACRGGHWHGGAPPPLTSPPLLRLCLQVGLAQMLKGGVIMDVVTPEEARIAEEAGAVAVMALERVPANIRRRCGVARMSDPQVRPAALRCCSCQCTGLWVAWLGSRAGRRR